MSTEVKPGQKWRRKRDGKETAVLYVGHDESRRVPIVSHRPSRLTATEYWQFIKKYEFMGGDDDE